MSVALLLRVEGENRLVDCKDRANLKQPLYTTFHVNRSLTNDRYRAVIRLLEVVMLPATYSALDVQEAMRLGRLHPEMTLIDIEHALHDTRRARRAPKEKLGEPKLAYGDTSDLRAVVSDYFGVPM